jgi:hypothetical protein
VTQEAMRRAEERRERNQRRRIRQKREVREPSPERRKGYRGFVKATEADVEAESKVPFWQRPRVKLVSDQASENMSLAYALLFYFGIRCLFEFDPYHRVSNDILGGIRGAGCNQALLLSVVVFNLAYGPWLGQAWFQRYKTEAANFFRLGDAFDPVFLWICWRIGMEGGRPEAFGMEAAEEWAKLVGADFLLRKGPKVLLTRWGSWFRAMLFWMSQWSMRTLILCIYGIQMGWVSKKGSTLVLQKLGVLGPPQGAADAGDNPTMRQQKESVRDAKMKAESVMHLCMLLHLDEILRLTCFRILIVCLPLHMWLVEWQDRLRSRAACRDYLEGMASGWAVLPSLLAISKVFGQTVDLERLTFISERLVSTERYNLLALDHPAVMSERQKAKALGDLMASVLSRRWQTAGEFFYGYPNAFYRLAAKVLLPAVALALLRKMRLLHRGLKRAAETTLATQPFWIKILEESQLNYVVVSETFAHAAGLEFREEAADDMRKAAVRDSEGIGQSGVQENDFRLIREQQRNRKDEKVTPEDAYMTSHIHQLLTKENHYSEVDGTVLPELNFREARKVLPRRSFLPDFEAKTIPLQEIVSKSKKPPYVSFKPESSHEQWELNELVIFLADTPDEKLDDSLALAPACWRTRFLTRGIIVQYTDEPVKAYTEPVTEYPADQLFFSGGGAWSTRLWPMVEETGPGGVSYFRLKEVGGQEELPCRPLRSFADVLILRTEYPCPLVWYIRNGHRPSCRSLPEGCLAILQEGDRTMPMKEWLARAGFPGQGRDDLSLLCNLELGIYDQVESLHLSGMTLAATQKILGIDGSSAAQVMQASLGSEQIEAATISLLESDGAQDLIGKEDTKVVGKMLGAARERESDQDVFKELIRRERSRGGSSGSGGDGGGGGAASGSGSGAAMPVKYVGDRALSEDAVRELAPSPCYVYRDEFGKRWQLFYGSADATGWTWSVSRAWGPTGRELEAIRFVLAVAWRHHVSLTGEICFVTDLDLGSPEVVARELRARIQFSELFLI